MATPEIIIYGAGIFGLSIAFEILKRGEKVNIIEIKKINSLKLKKRKSL